MGDDGDVAPLKLGVHEYPGHRSQLLAAATAHDARLAEQGVHRDIGTGERTGMRRSGPAAGLGTARFDGGYPASFAYQRRGVTQELLRIVDAFDIKQLDARTALRIERLVEVFEGLLHAYLRRVAHRPDTVELQPFPHAVVHNEDGRRPRARDEIHPFGVELRDGRGERTVVIRGQDTRAVGPYQCPSHRIDYLHDTAFERCTLLVLLPETGRKDDERAGTFLFGENLHRMEAIFGGNGDDGAIHLRKLLHRVAGLHALHAVCFRIDHIGLPFERALQQIAQHGAAGFVYVVRAAYHDDTGRIEQFLVYHINKCFFSHLSGRKRTCRKRPCHRTANILPDFGLYFP